MLRPLRGKIGLNRKARIPCYCYVAAASHFQCKMAPLLNVQLRILAA